MILNLVLLILGALFLLYGIKQKLNFWIVIGAVLLGLGAVSVCMDLTAAGTDGIDGHRLPFVIDRFMMR